MPTTRTMEENNLTTLLFTQDYDSDEHQATRIILIIVSFLIQMIGVPLVLGVIFYEHYGSDPQKRTVLNQLLSGVAMFALLGTIVPMNFINYRLLFGPIQLPYVTFAFFALKSGFVISGLFTLNEMVIIRYLTVFVWKKVIPITDGFFFRFLFLLNLLIGLCFGIWGNMGHNVERQFLYIMSKTQPPNNCHPTFK